MSLTKEAIELLIETGTISDPVSYVNDMPIAVIPKGYELRAFPELRDKPVRIHTCVTALTLEAFTAYWNDHATEHSRVFADIRNGRFCGVIDYHGSDGCISNPSWCSHRLVYECPQTVEWTAWKDKNGVWMKQEEFALFIEDHAAEVVSPDSAQMLEIALTLQAKKAVEFRQGTRLDNGAVQFLFNETIEAKAGQAGQFEIPQIITIGVRLFHGGPPYAAQARFRYRLDAGKLSLKYDLIRPHLLHDDAMQAVLAAIREGCGAHRVLEATV